MKRAYVSDFTKFMEQHLADNPAVAEERKRNWASMCPSKDDPRAPEISKQAKVRNAS